MTPSDPVEEAVRLGELAVRELAAGRPGDALPLCVEALGLVERELGASSADAANVAQTLGTIREGLSDYVGAESAFRRAAAILAGPRRRIRRARHAAAS